MVCKCNSKNHSYRYFCMDNTGQKPPTHPIHSVPTFLEIAIWFVIILGSFILGDYLHAAF